MHKRLSWLTVKAKLKPSLLLFMVTVIWDNTPIFCEKLYRFFVMGVRHPAHLVEPSHHTNYMMIEQNFQFYLALYSQSICELQQRPEES